MLRVVVAGGFSLTRHAVSAFLARVLNANHRLEVNFGMH